MKTGFLLCLLLLSQPLYACDELSSIQNVHKIVSSKLLENAPTFRHGWDDKHIKLTLQDTAKSGDICMVRIHLELPQTDLDEVNNYLDKNPAKRILLGAQGYSIPENRIIDTDYFFSLSPNGAIKTHNESNKPLADLFHSLEFMYQLLAQLRAEVSADSTNNAAWPQTDANAELKSCQTRYSADDIVSSCQCRLEQLSQKLSSRQMELVNFIMAQPYAAATGSLIGYIDLSKNINHGCGLKKR